MGFVVKTLEISRFLACLVLGGGLLATGCKRGEAAQQQMPAAPVTVAETIVRDVPYYLDEIGRCASRESVTLMPQIAGRINAAPFVEGADVKKGDLLFAIDPRPFQAALEEAQATLLQRTETKKLAEIEYSRVEALRGTSAVSQTEYDQKKSAAAVAAAQVLSAQAAVDTAKLNLEYCSIRSPLDGRAGMRMVDPGNVVKENETGLVMIQSFDPIYAEFTIPEDRLGEVRANMANGTLKTLLTIPGENTVVFSTAQPATQPTTQTASARIGQVDMLDNSVQTNTGTVRLRATVPNLDRHFWPGQFVRIRLVLHEKKDATLIPSQAVQVGQKGQFVYVVTHDEAKKLDLAEMRPITPGQTQGDLVVVEKGLKPGEKVILTGQLMVQPGGAVMVMPDPTAPVEKDVAAKDAVAKSPEAKS